MRSKKIIALLLVLPVAAATYFVVDQRDVEKDSVAEVSPIESSVAATEVDPAIDTVAAPQQRQGWGNTEIIFGKYEVRVNPNCNWQLKKIETAGGETIEAVHCDPINKSQRAYESYDDKTLEMMAYHDAMAAWELSLRSADSDPNLSTQYLIRAIALDPHQVQSAYWASQYFPLTHPDDNINRLNRMARYAFARLDEQFRDEGSSELQLDQLLEAGGTPEDVKAAISLADQMIARVHSERSEIGILQEDPL